ncbi:MAG: NAD(P)H-dependent oxidoreductase [Oscillospiraceae bacterium]|jgi:FMN-dependent NADH-azoreductase
MNILFIDACISNHTESRTKKLCEAYLQHCCAEGHTVTTVALEKLGLQPLDALKLKERDVRISEGAYQDGMFDLARQFRDADRVVVGAPYWDLSFPSVVKVYIEHLMINGLTFHYVDNEAVGLCHADKLVYIMSAGGYVGECNFGYTYMKAIGQMMGIRDTELICAQGLDIWGADVDKILENTIAHSISVSAHDKTK